MQMLPTLTPCVSLCPCNSIRSLIDYPVVREHSLEGHRDMCKCQKLLQCKEKEKKFYKLKKENEDEMDKM